MKRTFANAFCFLVATTLLSRQAGAQALTTVNLSSGSQKLYSNAAKTTLLTAGTAAAGDGAVLQLGYYSAATTANNFAGTFVALSGPTSLDVTYANTTIGDDPTAGAGAGQFVLSLGYTSGSATTGVNLPAAGTPLVVLFYNNTTIATSTFFNAVSDDIWLWQTPATAPNSPIVAITLNDTNLEWLGGASTAFYTSQPTIVPEPSSLVFGAMACGGFGWVMLRRRRALV